MRAYLDYLKSKGYLTVGDLQEYLSQFPKERRVSVVIKGLSDGEKTTTMTDIFSLDTDCKEITKGRDNVYIGFIRN